MRPLRFITLYSYLCICFPCDSGQQTGYGPRPARLLRPPRPLRPLKPSVLSISLNVLLIASCSSSNMNTFCNSVIRPRGNRLGDVFATGNHYRCKLAPVPLYDFGYGLFYYLWCTTEQAYMDSTRAFMYCFCFCSPMVCVRIISISRLCNHSFVFSLHWHCSAMSTAVMATMYDDGTIFLLCHAVILKWLGKTAFTKPINLMTMLDGMSHSACNSCICRGI